MLYEPPKTKRNILIFGVAAVFLAVLVIVAAPLLFKNKTTQVPVSKLSQQEKIEQDKIQKEFENLEALRKSANAKEPTPEEIQREFAELEKQRTEANVSQPTLEQIQQEFDKLEQVRK